MHHTHHLASSHTNCLYGKLAATHIKQILEGRTKEVNDEDIMKALLAEVVYLGYSS